MYATATGRTGFTKVALKVFGAGALQAHLWASDNAPRVWCLVADCPVVDFKPWLAGTGATPAQPERWQAFLMAHGYASADEALQSKRNPIDRTAPLAEAKTPLLHLSRHNDAERPYTDQTGAFQKVYVSEKGYYLTVIMKPGDAPEQGLEDPLATSPLHPDRHLDGVQTAGRPAGQLADWRISDFDRTGAVYVEAAQSSSKRATT